MTSSHSIKFEQTPIVVAGEYNEFILEGEGTMITVPEDIMLFVNNTIIPSGMASRGR